MVLATCGVARGPRRRFPLLLFDPAFARMPLCHRPGLRVLGEDARGALLIGPMPVEGVETDSPGGGRAHHADPEWSGPDERGRSAEFHAGLGSALDAAPGPRDGVAGEVFQRSADALSTLGPLLGSDCVAAFAGVREAVACRVDLPGLFRRGIAAERFLLRRCALRAVVVQQFGACGARCRAGAELAPPTATATEHATAVAVVATSVSA